MRIAHRSTRTSTPNTDRITPRWPGRLALAALCVSLGSCKSDTPGGDIGGLGDPNGRGPIGIDRDRDGVDDGFEDRNRNGTVDPGETDPGSSDTDGDGVPDGDEVQFIACSPAMDRPFRVYDAPGAGSMVLVDAAVREHALLTTLDGKAPALHLADPDLGVAAVTLQKRPAMGVRTPAQQRELERREALRVLGRVSNQRTRSFTTVEGFEAEQAIFDVEAPMDVDAKTATALLAPALLGGVGVSGALPAGGPVGRQLEVRLLTVMRSPRKVALLAAVAVGATRTEAQTLRLDELSDGTNLARHGSFTRHRCDAFEAKAEAKADILFVVDDSGSMEDDQQAVRDAANAMESVLNAAQIDYRLGVAAHKASNQNHPGRGRLERPGLTADLAEFKRAITVGAEGGWEPGLETGLRAIDNLLPRTPAGDTPTADKLREGAATIVIHLSDERDQTVECLACGSCGAAEGEQRFCADPAGQRAIDDFVQQYRARNATVFAIVGDVPNGCRQTATRDDFEPGQGYVEVASATGGQFGSLCGDMATNLMDVARVASGVASAYKLTEPPASASIRVAIGPPGQGRAIPRSRTDGFDYDAVQNSVIFYGSARPQDGDEVVIGYRRWDWANNPLTPADPCDMCEMGTSCLPELDTAECQPICGDVICEAGLVCFETTGQCGDPANPPPGDACGGCDAGLVCDPSTEQCVPPCEQTGCQGAELCSSISHLCQDPGL